MILHSQAAWPPGRCALPIWPGPRPQRGYRARQAEAAEVPAGCLLGRVMPAAKRRQIAFAGAAALVVGDRVVVIAPPGGPPAAGERAGPVPGLDQVPQGR